MRLVGILALVGYAWRCNGKVNKGRLVSYMKSLDSSFDLWQFTKVMLVLLIISTFLHFINFALMIWVGRKEKKKIAKIVEQTAREISRRLKLQAVPSERIGSQSIMMESNEETTDFNST